MLKNWGNSHFHFLICLCTTFHYRIKLLFKKIRKILLSRSNLSAHHKIDIPQEMIKLSLSLSNWKHHSCFLGMRWFLLTFAFFQDRSLLLSYFSTSLPWLSKSTWISIVCKHFQEKKLALPFLQIWCYPSSPHCSLKNTQNRRHCWKK